MCRTADQQWKVNTLGYIYAVQTASSEAVIDAHWHPGSKVRFPHYHVGTAQLADDGVVSKKDHIKTSRASLEDIVSMCITEWHVRPIRDDWKDVLAVNDAMFKLYRSWSEWDLRNDQPLTKPQ